MFDVDRVRLGVPIHAEDLCLSLHRQPLRPPNVLQVGQAKELTGGGDLREAQVDVPLSVSHSCV